MEYSHDTSEEAGAKLSLGATLQALTLDSKLQTPVPTKVQSKRSSPPELSSHDNSDTIGSGDYF